MAADGAGQNVAPAAPVAAAPAASPAASPVAAPAAPASVSAAPVASPAAPARLNHVSLASLSATAPTAAKNAVLEPVMLTPEILERLWKKLINETAAGSDLANLISSRRVAFVDATHFNILNTDPAFETRFAAFLPQVEQTMQSLNYTNNPAVRCRVVTEEQKKRLTYEPEEKYKQMAEKNPAMESLRKIFPDLEIG